MDKEKESHGYCESGKEYELYGYYEVDNKNHSGRISFFRQHFVAIVLSLLMAIFVVLVVWPFVTVTIHAGERGVLFRRVFPRGVNLERVYEEGLHFVLPWNILTRYNIRIQEVFDSMAVLTLEGMEVKLDLSIRYQPYLEKLPYLHEEVGPNYAKSVVVPEVKGIVLSVFGNKHIEGIYTDIYQLIEDANIAVKEDLINKHIIIDELVVKAITLPDTVRNSINEKIRYRQIALGYKHRIDAAKLEAVRKEQEAIGIQSFQSIVSEGINENYLKWKGIDATLKLAISKNSKIVVIGSGKQGLPLILNADTPQGVNEGSGTNLKAKKKKD